MGRQHLARLVRTFDFSIADSSYNAQELIELGYENVTVFPIMIDLDAYQAKESVAYRNLHRDERKNMLFVGRISPNKGIEELVKVLFFYKKYLSANIRLIVAGNTRSLPKYFYALRDLAAVLDAASHQQMAQSNAAYDDSPGLDGRIAALRSRMTKLRARITSAISLQQDYTRELALDELDQRQLLLERLLEQASLELAKTYDYSSDR